MNLSSVQKSEQVRFLGEVSVAAGLPNPSPYIIESPVSVAARSLRTSPDAQVDPESPLLYSPESARS